MDTNLQGNIGEAKALAYFITEGYNVYLPFGTASKNDMLIEKDNLVKRVSIKTSTNKMPSGKYKVRIRQGKLNKQIPFDKEASDILCVYIIPEDRIVILQSKDVKTGFEICVK